MVKDSMKARDSSLNSRFWVVFFRGPKTTKTYGSYVLVLGPKTRWIPETMACRILVFMWSLGPLFLLLNLASNLASPEKQPFDQTQ